MDGIHTTRMQPDNNINNASADADADSPIRVVITPSQSSYFAGETFSVTVTFTNTSSPNSYYASYQTRSSVPTPVQTPTPTPGWHTPAPTPSSTPRTASSFKHKRASHSISSAPLARPPTSPGMSSWSVVVPDSGDVLSARASWWNRGPDRDPPENHSGIQSRRELILYAYAQLSGWVVLLPQSQFSLMSPSTGGSSGEGSASSYAMKKLRAKLAKKTVIGGGSMDLTPSLARVGFMSAPGLGYSSNSGDDDLVRSSLGIGRGHRPPRLRMKAGHGRSTSLAAGLISALMPPSPASPGRPPSSQSRLFPPQASQNAVRSVSVSVDAKEQADEADEDEDIDPETPLPMFESQPSMLAIDLSLAPGESKTYTYSMTLPPVLPPTFKGHCINFSYEFSVGVCRAGAGVGFSAAENGSVIASPPPSLASGNGVSRVMKVPIRVYNHVTVGRVPKPYDLLWPVGRRIWERYQGTVVDGVQTAAAAERKGGEKQGSVDELREYASRVLAGRIKKNDGDEEEESDGDVKIGCREAVEIVTRNPRKVSYDVSKDGVKVAVLTFTKSAYRLGETVLGVVEFNERRGRARVVQMSATLEAHEKLPSSLSPSSLETMTRIHAEQHQSLVMSVLRTTFSLDIPSDGAPAFQVGVGEETRDGGLEWRVRLSLLVVIAKEDVSAGTEGVRIKGMVRDGPRGEWGSSWRACESVAPLQKMDHQEVRSSTSGSGWAWYLASTILGVPSTDEDASDSDDYDGIKADVGGGVGRGVRYGGGELGWKGMATEVVECTVPVSVWAGNTAFKAVSVLFDL